MVLTLQLPSTLHEVCEEFKQQGVSRFTSRLTAT